MFQTSNEKLDAAERKVGEVIQHLNRGEQMRLWARLGLLEGASECQNLIQRLRSILGCHQGQSVLNVARETMAELQALRADLAELYPEEEDEDEDLEDETVH